MAGVPDSLPEEMRPMAESICESFQAVAKRLMALGLSYPVLDGFTFTLSIGERKADAAQSSTGNHNGAVCIR